ncbi:hypothetical protein GDO81_017315 [Engystomops pustulosus]|uniref:Uncharacterized protein n=1 Tax=Engystomops pustulosus TaxID=76066 RepID=A0AAV7AF06_ENGPU|nr:hypothetical protein GDO81_017315 [Engystomops pustulosus]
MWNPNQGMASEQPSSAPPPYDAVISTPSHGQPQCAPPPYTESQPGLSPYGQNNSAPPPYSNLPYAPRGQGYSVTTESNLGSHSARPSSYPTANGGQIMRANHETCERQDSQRHRGIVGRLLHGHNDPHEHHHHRHHEHHNDHHRHSHHGHHGLLGLLRHHTHHDSHDN